MGNEIILDKEQETIYNKIINKDVDKGDIKNIYFFHGKAGTGKSRVIKKILKDSGKKVQVLAPTSLAAKEFEDYGKPKTIDSFFYVEMDHLSKSYQNPEKYNGCRGNMKCYNALLELDILIIDEVSMVRSDKLQMIHTICQKAKDNDLPFGGIKVVLTGDIFQLPAIVATYAEEQYLREIYGNEMDKKGIWFYSASVIQKEIKNITNLELTKVHRQDDEEFSDALDIFRGKSDDDILMNKLEFFNRRVSEKNVQNYEQMIAYANKDVTELGLEKLDHDVKGDEIVVRAWIEVQNKAMEIDSFEFDGEILKKYYRDFKMPSQFDGEFTFKIGAKVMITSSNEKAGYINGDKGTIINYDETLNLIGVEIVKEENKKIVYVSLKEHTTYDLKYCSDENIIRKEPLFYSKVKQFPMRLAYSMTAHKAQGQTFENNVYIKLPESNSNLEYENFETELLYVALSRADSIEKLHLSRKIELNDIKLDDRKGIFIEKIKENNAK